MLAMSKSPPSFKNCLGLRVDEVALAIGVSPETVADWIRTNQLPAAKIGRTSIAPKTLRQMLK